MRPPALTGARTDPGLALDANNANNADATAPPRALGPRARRRCCPRCPEGLPSTPRVPPLLAQPRNVLDITSKHVNFRAEVSIFLLHEPVRCEASLSSLPYMLSYMNSPHRTANPLLYSAFSFSCKRSALISSGFVSRLYAPWPWRYQRRWVDGE